MSTTPHIWLQCTRDTYDELTLLRALLTDISPISPHSTFLSPCSFISLPHHWLSLTFRAAEAAAPAAVYLRFSAYRIEDRKVQRQGARWIPPLAAQRKARKGSQSRPLFTQAFCGAAVVCSHDHPAHRGGKDADRCNCTGV